MNDNSVLFSRRKLLRLGLAGPAVSAFGFDLGPAAAQVNRMKMATTRETLSVCCYCAVGCGTIIHTQGARGDTSSTGGKTGKPTVVHVEGDPDNPINRGALCSKGAGLKGNIVNDRRLTQVLYRAPGSDRFEEKSWDWAIPRIARRLKDTRDAKLREKDARGNVLNALTAVGVIGGCPDSNENNFLFQKVFRAGLGVVPIEQQARI